MSCSPTLQHGCAVGEEGKNPSILIVAVTTVTNVIPAIISIWPFAVWCVGMTVLQAAVSS